MVKYYEARKEIQIGLGYSSWRISLPAGTKMLQLNVRSDGTASLLLDAPESAGDKLLWLARKDVSAAMVDLERGRVSANLIERLQAEGIFISTMGGA